MFEHWDDVRLLVGLVRAGHPARAAETLKIDRTTIMRRVRRLEATLDATLIERRGGIYAASAAGKKFIEAAEAAETILERARIDLEANADDVRGKVVVGAPDGLASHYLAPRFTALQRAIPGLVIELATRARDFNVGKDGADIAVTLAAPEGTAHFARRLDDITLRLYGTEHYLSAHSAINTVTDLRGHSFVSYPEGLDFGANLRASIANFGIVLDQTFTSTNIVAQLTAVEHSAGLGLLPSYIARASQRLRPVLHDQLSVPTTLWLSANRDLMSLGRIKTVMRDIAAGFREDRWLHTHAPL